MKKKFFATLVLSTVLFFACVPPASAAVYTITLNEAVKLALVHSPEIKKAENNYEIAYRTEIVKKQEKEKAYTNWESTRFSAVAFEGDYRAKKKLWEYAKDDVEDKQVILGQTKEKTEYNIENQYLNILTFKNQLEVLQDTVEFQLRLVKIESVKCDLGLSTTLQLQQTREKVAVYQNQLHEMRNTLEMLQRNFNRTIGRKPEELINFAPVAFSPVTYTNNKKEGLEQAKNESLALEQFNRLIENKKEDKSDLDRAGNSDKYLLIETEMQQIELNIDDVNFGIETGMKAAWEKVELAKEKLNKARTSYDSTKKDYEYRLLQYQVGLTPELLIIQGEIELKQAVLDYEQAVYGYYLATQELALAQQGIALTP
jgi:outer membrane protein TolC